MGICTKDIVNNIFDDFIELHGDRTYGDDVSVLSGIGFLNKQPITVIGQKLGNELDELIANNFSMTKPCGFRKIARHMKLAEKFKRPIVIFIDTIGAFPGIEAEKNGQNYAISELIRLGFEINVPIISIILNQACSGGAMALVVADKLAIFRSATISSISFNAAKLISNDLKKIDKVQNSAQELLHYGIVEHIIEDEQENSVIMVCIRDYIIQTLKHLIPIPSSIRRKSRINKFIKIKL